MTRLKPLPAILALAFVIRAGVALYWHNIIAPDEVFQALEQAHRLVYHQGVVPWEFQVGLRNWAIPLVLAGPMAVAKLFTSDTRAGLVLIRLLLCAASLGIVWVAVKWGERFHGARGAWAAGLLAAVWPDLWLMAPHPLEEVLAGDILVPAVYLISTGRRTACAALLLGLAFALRLQLAPAIAVAGIVLCGRNPGRWLLALPVAAIPLLAAGALDWVSWGQPFRSFWLDIYLNLGLGVAAREFGASPALYFVFLMGLAWLWALPALLFLVMRGARVLRLPAILAAIIILTHSVIAHKEFRFIFPAIALAVPLAGVGLGAVLAGRQLRLRHAAIGLALLAGPLCSPWTWFMLNRLTPDYALFAGIAAQKPCLVAVGAWDHVFFPFDELFTGATRLTTLAAFSARNAVLAPDFVVATAGTFLPPPGYTLQRCALGPWIPFSHSARRQFCVWSHPADDCPAAPAPPFEFPFPAAAAPFRVRDRLTDQVASTGSPR